MDRRAETPRAGTGVGEILERAEGGHSLSVDEVVQLLSLASVEEREGLFAAARRVRAQHTGSQVFLYGFVYLSTYCRNDCHFCFYRKSNPSALRYRKSHQEVVRAAECLAQSGVHLIDLTMGEDPLYFREGRFEELVELVREVKEATGLPVMVSPGLVRGDTLEQLKESGASWYACYQESYDRSLFKEIRPGQDFDGRLEGKRAARRIGLLTEEGMLVGLGESSASVARTLLEVGESEADQIRAMSFVPQKGTPLSARPPGDPAEEEKIIAVMRLLFPDRLIPASLDVGGLQGLRGRLQAGANVITSLVPPGEGLAGVAQSSLDIDEARRTVSSVEPILGECGLTVAPREAYTSWIQSRLEGVGVEGGKGRTAC